MKIKTLKPGEYHWIDRGVFARGTKSGIQYGISYTFDGRRRREMVGDTITLARKVLAIRKAEIAQGRFELKKRIKQTSFSSLASRYLEHARASKKSWQIDQLAVKSLSQDFESKTLSEITAWQIEQFKVRRSETVSKRTVNIELSILRRMFGFARERGLFAGQSPMEAVKLYREDEKPVRSLSADEERRLLESSPNHLRSLIFVALHTGLRRGELLALKWPDVDFEARVLTVRAGKTGKIRFVPLNGLAIKVFRRLLKGSESEHVFTYQGRPLGRFYKTWWKSLRRAGIKNFRFHDLRHTFATRLVLSGVDLVTVKELMGHRSLQTTLRYAHPSPDHKRAAVERLAQSGTFLTQAKKKEATENP